MLGCHEWAWAATRHQALQWLPGSSAGGALAAEGCMQGQCLQLSGLQKNEAEFPDLFRFKEHLNCETVLHFCRLILHYLFMPLMNLWCYTALSARVKKQNWHGGQWALLILHWSSTARTLSWPRAKSQKAWGFSSSLLQQEVGVQEAKQSKGKKGKSASFPSWLF